MMKSQIINNSLFKILDILKDNLNDCDCFFYSDFRENFLKAYIKFNEYSNISSRDKNLIYPLKSYFENGEALFFTINEPLDFDAKINDFLYLTNKIINFWNDIVIDYRYLMHGPNIFYIFYCYLKKFTFFINELEKNSKSNFIINHNDSIDIIKSIQIMYCVFYSDSFISSKMNDNLYMYIEDLFDDFWSIFYDAKEGNIFKTHYRLERLSLTLKNRFNEFIIKYPKIDKFYKNNCIKNDDEFEQHF